MSGYRRFAAYVYEYRNERKAENVGFIKVEVREQICSMEMRLQSENIQQGDTGKVYGFVRNQGLMDGILLGTCTADSGVLYGSFTVNAENIEESGIAVTALGGMIIQTERDNFYGTEWDDEPIRPRNFRERKIEKKDRAQAEAIPIPEENIPERLEEQEIIVANKENVELTDTIETPENVKITENTEHEERTSELEAQVKKTEVMFSEEAELSVSEIPCDRDNIPDEEKLRYNSAEQPDFCDCLSTQKESEKQDRKRPSYPSRPIQCEKDCPFADCDTMECRKVTPHELCHFSRSLCGLQNNRFLQQGYRNFGHILLCMRENGQYILGVPGRYNQQERYSAEMFGFPFFKKSSCLPAYGCQSGYWYRIVNVRDIR